MANVKRSRATNRKLKTQTKMALPANFKPGFLRALDHRFIAAKLVQEMFDELSEALGGRDNLSPQQHALAERWVWTNIRLQSLETDYANGHGLDAMTYSQLTNTMLGLVRVLGLHRVARNLPSALDYSRAAAAISSTEKQNTEDAAA